MKFRLKTSGYYYDENRKNKLEKLGFHFEESHKVWSTLNIVLNQIQKLK